MKISIQGIRDTLNSIRQQYWILKGREAVKRVTRRCVVCKRHEGKSFPTPPMPDLPTNRVDDSPLFTNTGVDSGMPEVAEGKGCNWLTKGHTL